MAVDEVKRSGSRRRGCVGPFSLGPLVDVVWSSPWCPRITQPSTSLAVRVADAFPSESKAETPRLKRCLFRIHIPAVASPVVLLLLNVTSGRTRVSSMSNTTSTTRFPLPSNTRAKLPPRPRRRKLAAWVGSWSSPRLPQTRLRCLPTLQPRGMECALGDIHLHVTETSVVEMIYGDQPRPYSRLMKIASSV